MSKRQPGGEVGANAKAVAESLRAHHLEFHRDQSARGECCRRQLSKIRAGADHQPTNLLVAIWSDDSRQTETKDWRIERELDAERTFQVRGQLGNDLARIDGQLCRTPEAGA